MGYKITIDGNAFSTLDEFYDEMARLLTRDLTWRPGHNMDALHDLLRGGFGVHEVGESIEFCWTHAGKSRRDFGYGATAAYWEKLLQKCHPTNRAGIMQKLEAAQKHEGPTLFDIITGEILDKEDWYDHRLELVDEL